MEGADASSLSSPRAARKRPREVEAPASASSASSSSAPPLPPAAASFFSGRLREGANDVAEIADVLPRLSQMGYGHEVFTILAAAASMPRVKARAVAAPKGFGLRSVYIDVDRVQSYLAQLNFGPKKRALLMAACAYRRHARVRRLVEMGARLEAQTEDGSTALHWAALGGDTAIIAFLLDRGAVIGHRDVFGRTPLARACWRGRTKAI